jgi:hypothetical protein
MQKSCQKKEFFFEKNRKKKAGREESRLYIYIIDF